MWVPKHNAYLGLRCSICKMALDGVYSESLADAEPTIFVVVECECTNELEQKVAQLEEELKEKEEENNAEADG